MIMSAILPYLWFKGAWPVDWVRFAPDERACIRFIENIRAHLVHARPVVQSARRHYQQLAAQQRRTGGHA